MHPLHRLLVALFVAALLAVPASAQHIHINAGAVGTNQNAQLYFANGGNFVSNSGFVVTLTPTNSGPLSNTYQRAGVSFTALAATPDLGGPATGHAAPGSFLELQVRSVAGPPGSQFALWQQDEFTGDIAFQFSVPVGATNGTNRFVLSENDRSPGSDPYGHIHGRIFTTTKPGLHTIGFRILDTSANGTGGGPIHTPSEIFYLHFLADTVIARFNRSSNALTAVFGAKLGSTFYLESTPGLGGTNQWATVAGPFSPGIPDNNRLRSLTDTNATGPRRFHRLRVTTP